MWAIVRIQRCFRRFIKRKRDQLEAQKKMANTKERWKKKIEGEEYKPPTPPPLTPPPPPPREKTKEEKEKDEEEYMRRRRKSFSEESDFVRDFYEKQVPPSQGSDKGGHR